MGGIINCMQLWIGLLSTFEWNGKKFKFKNMINKVEMLTFRDFQFGCYAETFCIFKINHSKIGGHFNEIKVI